ncbi:hypothetical protein K457DRAFT_18540 [Linnemannia elongata AG-77]|uniref:Uncharacterized protein n=1 Tax=Linnemannia elongata AG-77 TaxID=1314771 RepID=A0A197JZ12_9FUNG|nr:hypothetical protein K457DRAFT_18540 [Linnemannia elongata AG-77]
MLLTMIKARNQGRLPLDMNSFFTPSIFAIQVSQTQPSVTSRVYRLSLRVKLNGIPRILMSLHNISDHMQLQSALGKNTVAKRKQLENHRRNLLRDRHRPVYLQQPLQFNAIEFSQDLRQVLLHDLNILADFIIATGQASMSCLDIQSQHWMRYSGQELV